MLGIYHCHDLKLAKDLGFDTVEVSANAWPGPDNLEPAAREAKALGLKVFLDPGWSTQRFWSFPRELFDYAYLLDEPNLKDWFPDTCAMNDGLDTLVVLSWIKPFKAWANSADYVFVDYYRPMWDLWSLAKFCFEFKQLQSKQGEKTGIVLPIRYSAKHIKASWWFWRHVMGVRHFLWYAYSLDGGKWDPEGKGRYLDSFPEWMEALKKINLEHSLW